MRNAACFVFILVVICCISRSNAQNNIVVITLMEKAALADFYPAPGGSWEIPPAELNLGPLSSLINLPESAKVIKKLEIIISINHSFNADLDVSLYHEDSGKILNLFDDIGGSGDGIYVHLDDNATRSIEYSVTNPIQGRFNLEEDRTLSAFNGIDASGWWHLLVEDDATADNGTLISWGLYIVD